ncbi:MAG: RNA polymerase sigma factor [Chloroflexota bacterium]
MEDAIDPRALRIETHAAADDNHIAEAAKRNPLAFGELYERYYTRIYRYVYHRVGAAVDAEDITAVVFMKALESLPSFQSRRNGFAPWLFRIARNSVVDHYRRRKKQCSLDAAEHKASDADPVGLVLLSERRSELHTLLECLSNDQRDVVLLRYSADLSFPEVAYALGKNEPAVRMLLHRALRKLKRVVLDV